MVQHHQRQDNKSPAIPQPPEPANNNLAAGISPDRKEILTLTIEIGEGRNENILIREGDDPYQLAHEFNMKHQIGD